MSQVKHQKLHVVTRLPTLFALTTLSLIALVMSSGCLNRKASGQSESVGPIRQLILDRRNPKKSEKSIPSGLSFHTIMHNGEKRTYYLSVPQGSMSSRPLPLVLVFHGGHANGEKMAEITQMHLLGMRAGFAVAYPEAITTDRVWNDGRSTTASATDDIAFVRALIDQLVKQHNIDERRIYATGASNGGMFSLRIGCDLSDRIAAIAPVVANMPVDLITNCKPRRPISTMIFNGTRDSLMPFTGGEVAGLKILGRGKGDVVSADATVSFWRKINSCTSTPTLEQLPDRSPGDGTRVTEFRWSPCWGETEVIHLVVEGGGHTWPGSSATPTLRKSGVTSQDISATKLIWEFFKRHVL